MAALLSYKNLESSVNRSFEMVKGSEENGAEPSYQVFSKVVSVVVSNPSTQTLSRSVNITFRHLEVIPPVPHPLFKISHLLLLSITVTNMRSKRISKRTRDVDKT